MYSMSLHRGLVMIEINMSNIHVGMIQGTQWREGNTLLRQETQIVTSDIPLNDLTSMKPKRTDRRGFGESKS